MDLSIVGRFVRGIRTSISHNGAVYGYSVMITASLGGVQAVTGDPTVPRLFLFVLGAAAAFALIEAAGTNFFRDRVKGDPPEVVMLGGALAIFSISAGLATAVGIAELWSSWVAWLVAPFGASTVYLVVVGIEMAFARRAEEAEGQVR